MTRISLPAVAVVLLLVSPASLVGPSLAAVDAGPASVGGSDVTATPAAASTVGASERIAWISVGATGSTTGYGNATADLGATLGADHTRLRARFESRVIEQKFEDAATSAERQAIVDRAVARIDDEVRALHERERALAEQYANGELSDEQFLRELAEIRSEARSLQETVRTVDELARSDESVDVTRHRLVGRLSRYDTPLRGEIAAALRADTQPISPVRISVVGDRLVMTRINGTTYTREAIQFDNYRPNGEIRFDSLLEVGERGAELYPWIYNNSRGDNSYRWYNSMMWFRVEHDRGEVQAYLDSTTRNVTLEHHRLDLEKLPTTPTVGKTGDELSVSAHRVPDGGPVWVNVTAADSDEPINASVTVGDRYTTYVGEDGEVWVSAPRGTTTVTASIGSGEAAENVSVTVREPSE